MGWIRYTTNTVGTTRNWTYRRSRPSVGAPWLSTPLIKQNRGLSTTSMANLTLKMKISSPFSQVFVSQTCRESRRCPKITINWANHFTLSSRNSRPESRDSLASTRGSLLHSTHATTPTTTPTRAITAQMMVSLETPVFFGSKGISIGRWSGPILTGTPTSDARLPAAPGFSCSIWAAATPGFSGSFWAVPAPVGVVPVCAAAAAWSRANPASGTPREGADLAASTMVPALLWWLITAGGAARSSAAGEAWDLSGRSGFMKAWDCRRHTPCFGAPSASTAASRAQRIITK
mmetsp:Transcript_50966/g.115880  ORF Transcript_50966/g.115880 Transcript_50966/m.115880 type:complete len:290 (-) Transcript_50966:60-929(-)